MTNPYQLGAVTATKVPVPSRRLTLSLSPEPDVSRVPTREFPNCKWSFWGKLDEISSSEGWITSIGLSWLICTALQDVKWHPVFNILEASGLLIGPGWSDDAKQLMYCRIIWHFTFGWPTPQPCLRISQDARLGA
jgi:hypothetical protein